MLRNNVDLYGEPGAATRIFVVEDEKIIAMEICKTLDRMGYHAVGHVARGEEAIEFLEHESVDLVLLDIQLDGQLDGIETAEILAQRFDVPFIFLTANADEETIQRAKRSSPYSYLVKPIDFRDLHTAIQIALHKYASELRIKQSEIKYRRVFERSNDGMIIFNTEGHILDCNTRAHTMLGYGREAFMQWTMHDLHSEETLQLYEKAICSLSQDGSIRYEAALRKKDGCALDVEINGSWFDEKGRQGLAVIRDLSEQRRAERAGRIVSEEVAGYTGEAFFQHLVQKLAEILTVDIAFIHEIEPDTGDCVKSIAFYDQGAIQGNIQYSVEGMPCKDIHGHRMLVINRDISKLYPAGALFREMQIESYAGVPMFSPKGEAMGHLSVMHRKPLENETLVRAILQLFALRAASELTRMKHEEVLKAGEEQYRMLFNSGNDAVFVYHLEEDGIPGPIVKVNDVACRLLGHSREKLLTFKPWEVIEEEVRADVPLVCQDNALFESVFIAGDGTRIPVEINTNCFQLGDQTTVLAVARDIRGRKAVESALLKERQLSDKLIQYSPALIYIKDVEGRYILANPAFLNFIGQSREEVLGTRDIDLFSLDSTDVIRKTEQYIRDTHQSVLNQELMAHNASGEAHWLLTSKMPYFDENNKLMGVICIAQDITSRVDSEKEMKRAMQAAESANRAKSEFLANISHELRTPMNGIIGLTELAIEEVGDAEVSHYLEMVAQSADSLLVIFNDILDFAKIEAGKVELEEVDFNLSVLMDNSISLYQIQAKKKNLTLDYDMDDTLKTDLEGDSGRLKQVLNNLFSNACKFTDAGKIQIRVHPLDLDNTAEIIHQLPHYQYVLFEVEDTGIGIPESHLEIIFSSFSQVDGSLTRKYGGTGLGLAISKQLVEMMGGAIWVESEPGKGSRFQFYVPFKIQKRKEGLNTVPECGSSAQEGDLNISSQAFADRKILVVEDDPVNREVVVRFLAKWGANVVTASHGKAAISHLVKQQFDLVIMDVQMPVLDGLEAARLIRSGDIPDVDTSVPIIALTAHARERDRLLCLEAGMDDYVSKPIHSALFFQVVKHHLMQSRESDKSLHAVDPVVSEKQVVNRVQVLARLGGDHALLIKTMHIFQEHIPARMQELSEAMSSRDREAVLAHAHSLKSAAANIGADVMRAKIVSLEAIAEASDWQEVVAVGIELEQAYCEVMEKLPECIELELRQQQECV